MTFPRGFRRFSNLKQQNTLKLKSLSHPRLGLKSWRRKERKEKFEKLEKAEKEKFTPRKPSKPEQRHAPRRTEASDFDLRAIFSLLLWKLH